MARAYGAVCTPDFFGYNADLGLQYRGRLDASRTTLVPDARRELVEAMRLVARTGHGPAEQLASMGCSIKWKHCGLRASLGAAVAGDARRRWSPVGRREGGGYGSERPVTARRRAAAMRDPCRYGSGASGWRRQPLSAEADPVPFDSLRSFIAHLEARGRLVRVEAPVSAELEITEIHTRLLAEKGPAVLFENVRGFGMPLLTNLFGTVERVAWGMGREPSELRALGEMLAFFKQPQPPESFSEAVEMLPADEGGAFDEAQDGGPGAGAGGRAAGRARSTSGSSRSRAAGRGSPLP